MDIGRQLSTGDLTDILRPALFIIAALCSSFVLFDSRPRFTRFQSAAWTLAALLIPPVIVPLYLAARLYARRSESDSHEAAKVSNPTGETPDETETEGDEQKQARQEEQIKPAPRPRVQWRELRLPLVYASVLLTLGLGYFINDRRSFDAHFARAKQAKLRGDRERTVTEYRAALARRDDAHTHKLLGLELLQMGRADESLVELRAAATKGETDDALFFYEGRALDALERRDEAVARYGRFIESGLCLKDEDDTRCAAARVRLARR